MIRFAFRCSTSLSLKRSFCDKKIKISFDKTRNVFLRPYSTQIGLFGVNKLHNPKDWQILAKESIEQCNQIISQLENYQSLSAKEVVKLLDDLSDTICKVSDPSEACSCLHPDQKFKEKSTETSGLLHQVISKYNTSQLLYQSSIYATEHKSELTDEEFAVAEQLKIEFEHHGINLNPSKLKELNQGQEKIFNLISEFRNKSQSMNNLDSTRIVEDLLKYRHETSEILGFESYSDMMAWQRDIKSPDEVFEFLDHLKVLLEPKVQEEIELLEKLKNDTTINISKISQSLDFTTYLHLIKQKAFRDNSHDKLYNYFSLGNVLQGLADVTNKLFGIQVTFQDDIDGERWHPSVFRADLHNENKEFIGSVYLDLFTRPNKFRVSANYAVRLRSERAHPVTILSLHIEYKRNQTIFLTYGDLCTFYHEWGHSLQSLLCENKLQHFSGIRGPMDYVETPSTFFENFAKNYDVVSQWARHSLTGEELSKDLFKQCTDRNPFIGLETAHTILVSAIDQKIHSGRVYSLKNVLEEMEERYFKLPHRMGMSWLSDFNHLIGYGACYYSYLRCTTLSDQLWMKMFKDDPLSRENGHLYRNGLLKYGGYKNSTEIIRDVTKEEPNVKYYIDKIKSS